MLKKKPINLNINCTFFCHMCDFVGFNNFGSNLIAHNKNLGNLLGMYWEHDRRGPTKLIVIYSQLQLLISRWGYIQYHFIDPKFLFILQEFGAFSIATRSFLGHWILTNVCVTQADILTFASSTPACAGASP